MGLLILHVVVLVLEVPGWRLQAPSLGRGGQPQGAVTGAKRLRWWNCSTGRMSRAGTRAGAGGQAGQVLPCQWHYHGRRMRKYRH